MVSRGVGGNGLVVPRSDGINRDQLQTIHEYLAEKRMLFLYGEITGFPYRLDYFASPYIIDSMLTLESLSPDEPIWLFIDSVGGAIQDGLMLYDVIKTIQCPVYTVGRNCYSLAAVILAAGAKSHRYLYPHSRTMIHLPSGVVGGDATDIKIQTEEMQKTKDLIVRLLQECGVKHTSKKILKDMDRDLWMNTEESIAYGLADKQISKGFLLK